MGEYKLFFSVRNFSKWTNCNMEAADRKSRKVRDKSSFRAAVH